MEFKEVRVEYTLDADKRGFAVNVDAEDFEPETVPAYLIMIAKHICDQAGINFGSMLKSALVVKVSDGSAEA